MADIFNTITNPLSSEEHDSERDADQIIDHIETTLETALERRQDIKRTLHGQLREYRLKRKKAEAQIGGSMDDDIELAGQRVEGYEEVIDELRDRIKGLNQQIVAIEKRLPTLQILRTDAELMRRLKGEETVQEDVQQLMKTLDGGPRESSADTQLQTLLQSIDSMADQSAAQVPASPTFPVLDEIVEETDEQAADSAETGAH